MDKMSPSASPAPVTQLPASTLQPTPAVLAAPDKSSETGDSSKQENDEPEYLGPKALTTLVFSLLLVVIILTLDQSILATAIPKITDHFHTIADIGWYGSAYLLATAALQPMTGKVYTYFSLKYSFLAFVAVFEVGSLISALATSSSMLIVGRAVSGIGGSGIINGALTIIAVAAHPHKRPTMLAIVMSMAGAGQLIGPLIGGALTQHATWRWCFWINLPIGGVTILTFALIQLPAYSARKATWTFRDIMRDFDVIGFGIFAPACIMMLLALQWGGSKYDWSSATIIGLLVGSIVTFAVFGLWEHHHGDNAMIPSSLVRQRVIYSSMITTFFSFGGLIIQSYYLPLWFQTVKSESPTMSAVLTLPSFIPQIISAILSGALVSRIGYLTPLAIVGNILASIATGLFSTFRVDTAAGKYIGYQIIGGFGRGMAMQQPLQAVQSVVKPEMIPTATANVMWGQTFGGSMFLGLAQAAFVNLLRSALKSHAPGVNPTDVIDAGATNFINGLEAQGDLVTRQAVLVAYNQATTRVFYLSVGCALGALVSCLGIGKTRVKTKYDEARKQADAEKAAKADAHGEKPQQDTLSHKSSTKSLQTGESPKNALQ